MILLILTSPLWAPIVRFFLIISVVLFLKFLIYVLTRF